jgi:hypothetical protein
MFITKLKLGAAALLGAGLFVALVGGSLSSLVAQDGKRAPLAEAPTPAKTPQIPEKEKGAITAWGKEIGGLQAGLSISNPNDIQIGGKATAVVKLRNLSNKSITASVWPLWLPGPQVVDTQGKQVRATRAPHPLFEIIPTKITLQPGQTVEMAKSTIFVVGAGVEDQPIPEGVDHFTIYVRPGTYKVGFAGFLQEHPNLATGTMEFKVKDAEDGLTAWGKEVGGLQAGLSYQPGQKRAYSQGETVTLVVRVRNVGKEEVKFQYLRQFFIENPPTVTDGDGKPIPQPHVTAFGTHLAVEVNLAPGKEIELYEWKRELRPAKWIGNDGVPSLYGTGRFSVEYERVLGNSSAGTIKLDPILSKLGTGKLELEIKSDPRAKEGKAGEPPQQQDKTKQDDPPRPVHLMHIALAMHGYHQAHGQLLPAGISGINDPDGKPLLSWRVAILPYIEQQELHKEFDLNEPWDHPTNKKLIAKMPEVFVVPGAEVKEGETNYRVLVGPGTVFEVRKDKDGRQIGIALSKITDGTSNAVMVVEAKESTIWTKPDDLAYDPKGSLPKLGVSANGFHVAMADGSIRFIRATTPEKILRPYLTGNNGKSRAPLDGEKPEPGRPGKPGEDRQPDSKPGPE